MLLQCTIIANTSSRGRLSPHELCQLNAPEIVFLIVVLGGNRQRHAAGVGLRRQGKRLGPFVGPSAGRGGFDWRWLSLETGRGGRAPAVWVAVCSSNGGEPGRLV